MKRKLMNILVCPHCRESLLLSTTLEDGDEVVEGLLSCGCCDRQFPINDSIPNLLPQDLRE